MGKDKLAALISDKVKGIGLITGGTTASSVAPKVVGYKDKEDNGSFAARAGVTGGSAAISAAAFNPRKTLPKNVIKKIVRAGGKPLFKFVEKRTPIAGAGWGAISGLSSYEAGRKLKDIRDIMKKEAGMIDSIQENLAPEVFDKNNKMHDHVRKHFMDELSTKIDLDRVEKFMVIGGITSYQYSPTSDIDLSVYIEEPPEEWEGSEKSSLVGDISYQYLPGTKRKYQYYVVPWTEYTAEGLKNRSFGSYDILANEWYTPTRPRDSYAPPEEKYKGDLRVARHKARELDKLVSNFKQAKRTYTWYKKKRYEDPKWSPTILTYHKRKAQWALKNLTELVKQVSEDRYKRYSAGWGVPRNAKENVVFKLLSYGPHSGLMYTLSRVELPPNVEDINVENIEGQPDLEKTAESSEKSNTKWTAGTAGFIGAMGADIGYNGIKKQRALKGYPAVYAGMAGFAGGAAYDWVKNKKRKK